MAEVTDAPAKPEAEVEDAFDQLVDEGETRLARPLLALLTTAFLGGIDIGAGVLAYLLVDEQTHSTLLAGIAFSIGFVILLMAKGELFTENFLVPVTAVLAKRGTLLQLARLWAATIALNLLGGWIITFLIVKAKPELVPTAREVGAHYADLGVSLESFCLAVLAGAVITLMTRMQHSTDQLGLKIVPALLMGSVLAGAQLFHCVLDSLLMFAGLWAGASYGYLDWLGAFGWSAFGNVVGGLLLVTFVRVLRVPHRLAEEREENG